MCILCVIQKCSRRIATMLPWLVIPLIGLWAMSQLLPPAFRFEITSPRLACVMVLLSTLFWYEVLMPQLSAWRAKRKALLQERMRYEANELQKLRKTATRKCRNCSTAYRDQNPGGGKFMCSYCGHVSKRPVLDLPVPPEAGNSGILKYLMGKGGRILSSKAWSESGWMCGQDWLDNGNWGGSSYAENRNNWKNCGDLYGTDKGDCPTEKSSRKSVFACRLLLAFFSCVIWLWRKIFRLSSSRDDALDDSHQRGMLVSKGDTGGSIQESRGDKARRKAEEKRLARLEKELLEEEERKQREEVAKLVEETRKLKLRDQTLEAEKQCGKVLSNTKEKDCKKESDMKRRERRIEKDRGSSKSNSDVEELERRVAKETDRSKKSEGDKRDQKRFIHEISKNQLVESAKTASPVNQSRGNAGTRYFERMRGTFLSSSRAFTGGDFFRKSSSQSNVPREQKSNAVVENSHTSVTRKETLQQDQRGRASYNLDNTSANGNVFSETQPIAQRPWIRLFSQPSSSPNPSSSNSIDKPTEKHETEPPNSAFSGPDNSTESFNSSFNLGQPSAFLFPSFPFGLSSGSPATSVRTEPVPQIGDPPSFLPEDSENYGDPCYVPDEKHLLGPLSESLDDFGTDAGSLPEKGLGKPFPVKTRSIIPEVVKPSPIESPLSRAHLEKHSSSFLLPGTPNAQNNLVCSNELRAWQVWNNPPIMQDAVSFDPIGRPSNWIFHTENNMTRKEELFHPLPNKASASLFNSEQAVPGAQHPQNVTFGSFQNGGAFKHHVSPVVDGPWLPPILPEPENQILLKPRVEAVDHSFEYSDSGGSANPELSWTKNDSGVQPPRDGIGSSPISRSHIRGLYQPSDVQSLWSFD